ncbi:hypothetical protein [Heyndrickxia oleronia]|jgi:hypothetical protein|nr:hypothetical protein [Heyndrickxia oleronia]
MESDASRHQLLYIIQQDAISKFIEHIVESICEKEPIEQILGY